MCVCSLARLNDGAWYAFGVQYCWLEDAEALRIADELDGRKSPMAAMSADQLRTLSFANRGDWQRFEQHRHRAEMHAVKHGTAWRSNPGSTPPWAPPEMARPLV